MAKSTIKALHDHLKASGTGQAKLDVVNAAASVTEAVEALAESFPGTHAKAVAFLETVEPEAAAPAVESKPQPGRWKASKQNRTEEAEPEAVKGD